jgi:cell division protein FtsZ
VLINITGGPDMTLFEVDQAANRIRAEVDPDANIIFGGTLLENMEGRLRVSVVATGIESEALTKMPPNVEPLRPRQRPAPLGRLNAAGQNFGGSPPAAAAAAARVQSRQILEDVMAVAPEPEPVRHSPIEPLIFGNEEAPAAEEEIPPMPAVARAQPLREVLPEAKPEPKRRRFFGGRNASRRCGLSLRRCNGWHRSRAPRCR